MPTEAWSAVEHAARDAYGQLLAKLASSWRDISAAEDALADALCTALERWPEEGIPDNPQGWLFRCAHREMLQVARHRKFATSPTVEATLQSLVTDKPLAPEPFLDARLRLLFVCANPAIDAQVRTPLMLQTVLGLKSERIAQAFMVSPTAMAQRLVRAKQKIRDAGISFEEPERSEWEERLGAVLECLYAAFGAAHEQTAALAEEALFLARILVGLLPNEPEVLALLALLTFSHARRRARLSKDGAFVLLAQQDVTLWDREAIVFAEQLLRKAAAQRRPGPFQLEAAIQSAHCQRLFSGTTPWRAIAHLYRVLNELAPTIASRIGHAVAELENGAADEALRILDDTAAHAPESIAAHQPYWVARAHVLSRQVPFDLPRWSLAMDQALALTIQPELRVHLLSVREGILSKA
jgi:RNA polymerase sigma-70 factor (ECF subfamily)